MSQFPEHFGKYVLLRKVAKGGMAEIFLAKNVGAEGFEKDVVIKRILPHYSEDEEFVTMFIDEASIASKLTHANIVQIFDFNQVDGAYYIAMEYVNGKDLKDVISDGIRSGNQLNPEQCVSIIIELAKALHYAHTKKHGGVELNIVHRDISPQNAMLSFGGEVKLMDFGIAKAASRSTHTVAGTVKGKCAYMSPEQAKGKQLDGRSDCFALGVVLWEMLTTKRLFLAESDFMTLTNVLKMEAPPPSSINPDVPSALDLILLKCLEKDRDDRYKDAQEFERALTKWFYANVDDLDAAAVAPYMKAMYASNIVVNQEKSSQERTMFMVAEGLEGLGGDASDNPAPAPDEATRALPAADFGDLQIATTMMDGDMSPDAVAELRKLAAAGAGDDESTRMLGAMPSPSGDDESTRMLGAMPSPAADDESTRMIGAMADVDLKHLVPTPPPPTDDYEQGSTLWMWMLGVLVLLAGGGVAAWYFVVGPGASPSAAIAGAETGPVKEKPAPDPDEPADGDLGEESDAASTANKIKNTADAGPTVASKAADAGKAGKDANIGKVAKATPGADAGPTKAAGGADAAVRAASKDVAAAPKADATATGKADTGTAVKVAPDAGPSAPTPNGTAGAPTPTPTLPAARKTTQILVTCAPGGQVSASVGTVENQGMAWAIKDVALGSVVKVTCFKAGYRSQAQDVVAQNGVQLPFALRKIVAGYGSIAVNARPWAKCSVGSKRNATTPIKIKRIKAGRYRVVCKNGGKTKSAVLKVKPGKTARKVFKFKR